MKMSIEQFVVEVLKIQDGAIIKKLSDCGEIIHLKKSEILFHQDYEPEYIAFLLNGIMRSFVVAEKGSDSTECFDYEFGCPVVPSIPMNAPASVNIEAETDSDLILFPVDEVMELIHTNVEISTLYNNLMCRSMQRFVRLARVLSQYTAAQRYEWFLTEYAPLDGKVSNKAIASYLNMSPVTLSHVRKEYKKVYQK
ncbi:MAG: Crp/Fnr family transcriptional regulator [Clostridia bacterium]